MSDLKEMPYAEIAVPVPLFRTYHYQVPAHLLSKAVPGTRALVPFGAKLQTGFILERLAQVDFEASKMKPILQVLDAEPVLTPEMIGLARWVSDFFLAPLGETLRVFLPPGLEVASVAMVSLTDEGRQALRAEANPLPPQRKAVLESIEERGTTTLRFLQKAHGLKSIYSLVASLQEKGWISVFQKTRGARVREKMGQLVCLTEAGARIRHECPAPPSARGGSGEGPKPKQLAVLNHLAEFRGPFSPAALKKQAGATPATLKTLQSKGWVRVEQIPIRRRPLDSELHEAPAPPPVLTVEQQSCLQSLCESLDSGSRTPVLLHGVTGSGKTEIYLRLVQHVLDHGGHALVLVPEIGLTPAAWQLFRSRFREQVALLHSGLSDGERHDEWFRVRRGEVSVVVGTRSAVFAPLQHLRLIIIDEEHDGSYKQDEAPRYHARDVALKRADSSGALVLLGSATPSMETYYQARLKQRFGYLRLAVRVLNRPLASSEIVDMQEEFLRHGPAQVISGRLKHAMEEHLSRGQQVMLLLNRRGFAPTLLCRSCGAVLRCDHCSVAMTFHQAENLMICHHCSRIKGVPGNCPACQSRYIFYLGEGTEKLQILVAKLLPGVKVDRMDSDTTSKRGSYFRILKAFARGETRILIGTQMIAKGHDFPSVTLAGVVAADQGLAMPDFRAAERTFQLLTQVAGRSGRGEVPGEVIVQTRFPNHYSLKFACEQNYEGFFEQEIEHRKALGYPPFTSLANLVFKGPDQQQVIRSARQVGEQLQRQRRDTGREGRIRILGPAPAPLERIKGNFRYQILLKSVDREELRQLLKDTLERLSSERLRLVPMVVDLDPLSLL